MAIAWTTVGFPLHAVHLVPPLEPHPVGLAQQQPVGRAIGACPQFLAGVAIEVLAHPGLTELIRVGLEGRVGKAVLSARLSKEPCAFGSSLLRVRARWNALDSRTRRARVRPSPRQAL